MYTCGLLSERYSDNILYKVIYLYIHCIILLLFKHVYYCPFQNILNEKLFSATPFSDNKTMIYIYYMHNFLAHHSSNKIYSYMLRFTCFALYNIYIYLYLYWRV